MARDLQRGLKLYPPIQAPPCAHRQPKMSLVDFYRSENTHWKYGRDNGYSRGSISGYMRAEPNLA